MLDKLPTKWDDVQTCQFIEISEIDFTTGYSLHNIVEKISILLDLEYNDILNLPNKEIIKAKKILSFADNEPRTNQILDVGKRSYIGCDNLTLREFIDLDYYYSDGYPETLTKMLSILYRGKSVNNYGREIIEPYDYSPKKYADSFDLVSIVSVYGVIQEFDKFRKNFMSEYSNLFDDNAADEETEDYTEEMKQDHAEEMQRQKFSWEFLLHKLTNGDITKNDNVLDTNIVYLFNYLSMTKNFIE